MDDLKKYLQHHADELDRDEPREQVWQKIQQRSIVVKKRAVVKAFIQWAVAASVLVLAGIGSWYVFSDQKIVPATIALNPTEIEPPVPVQQTLKEPILEPIPERVISKNKIARKQVKPYLPYAPYISSEEMSALHELENSFTQVINLQKERISSMPMYAENPDYFNDFKLQIRQMEKDEKSIQTDIHKQGINDGLLNQLINLYQQKLSVLKQLQLEMNKTNNRYKQTRGPVDSVNTYFLTI